MKREGIITHERQPATTRILTTEELIAKIYQGGGEPKDPRFLPKEKGGAFSYFFLSELRENPIARTKKFFPVVEVHGEIVALAELEEDPYKEHNLWLKFVSVDQKFEGQGYASRLLDEIFMFAHAEQCSLEISMYSEAGEIKLKPKIEQLSQRYDVHLVE